MELEKIEKRIQELENKVDNLAQQLKELRQKSIATCDACSMEFDLLANHYSIGLFDNIVYVKCPRCNKAAAVDSKDGVKKA